VKTCRTEEVWERLGVAAANNAHYRASNFGLTLRGTIQAAIDALSPDWTSAVVASFRPKIRSSSGSPGGDEGSGVRDSK
jgi:hypothetical protein